MVEGYRAMRWRTGDERSVESEEGLTQTWREVRSERIDAICIVKQKGVKYGLRVLGNPDAVEVGRQISRWK